MGEPNENGERSELVINELLRLRGVLEDERHDSENMGEPQSVLDGFDQEIDVVNQTLELYKVWSDTLDE